MCFLNLDSFSSFEKKSQKLRTCSIFSLFCISCNIIPLRYNENICVTDYTTDALYDSGHTSASSKSEYPCLNCSKTFFSRQNLKRHINALHVGVRYQCEFCDATLTQLDNLVRHKRIRHGIIALQNSGFEEK